MLATAIGTARPGADVLRTVYFSAVDAKGVHVTDLTAADLTVKEGGKDRAIEAVRPATAPMQLSILVDDGGTGGFQGAVSQFIRATFGRAEFSIRVLNPQAIKVVDFTRNGDELRAALGRMGPRGRIQIDGEQIIAGVFDAAKELQQRRARRASIIALTVTGENDAVGPGRRGAERVEEQRRQPERPLRHRCRAGEGARRRAEAQRRNDRAGDWQ